MLPIPAGLSQFLVGALLCLAALACWLFLRRRNLFLLAMACAPLPAALVIFLSAERFPGEPAGIEIGRALLSPVIAYGTVWSAILAGWLTLLLLQYTPRPAQAGKDSGRDRTRERSQRSARSVRSRQPQPPYPPQGYPVPGRHPGRPSAQPGMAPAWPEPATGPAKPVPPVAPTQPAPAPTTPENPAAQPTPTAPPRPGDE